MADLTSRGRGALFAGSVAVASVVLASCSLPGTQAPVGGLTVHVAGVPAVLPPPSIAVNPANQSQDVGLDAPIVVTASTGHLDTISVTEAGASGVIAGALSPDGRSWRTNQALDPAAHYTVVATPTGTPGATSETTSSFTTVSATNRLLTAMTLLVGETVG